MVHVMAHEELQKGYDLEARDSDIDNSDPTYAYFNKNIFKKLNRKKT